MTMLLQGAGLATPAGGAPLLTLADTDFCYPLDEASGTRVDAGPNGYDLTDVNTVGSGAGKLNNAAVFVAASLEMLTGGVGTAQAINGDFTFAFWVKLNSKTGHAGTNGLIGKWDTGGEYIISYEAVEDQFRFYLVDTALYASTFGSPTVGVWYFVVVRRSGSTIAISVNNGTENTGTKAGDPTADRTFSLGGLTEGGGDNFCDCALDQVMKFPRSLTPTEIAWLYNGGAGRTLA